MVLLFNIIMIAVVPVGNVRVSVGNVRVSVGNVRVSVGNVRIIHILVARERGGEENFAWSSYFTHQPAAEGLSPRNGDETSPVAVLFGTSLLSSNIPVDRSLQ